MDWIPNAAKGYVGGGRDIFQDIYYFMHHPDQIFSSVVDYMNQLDPRQNTAIIILTGVGTLAVTIWFLANFTNVGGTAEIVKEKLPVAKPGSPPIPPPTEIISLRIYPIKSCRGIKLDNTRLKKTGLSLDRNWMFVTKDDYKFMTIRGESSMTLIDTALIYDEETRGQMLEVSIHGTDARIRVPTFPSKEYLEANTKLVEVEIWEKKTDAWEYGDDINKIFSDYFNKPVALVYKGPTSRMVDVNGKKELYGKDQPHHFADVMSLQVASEASFKDLARRVGQKPSPPSEPTIERFRPNIIVRGRDDHPWEEDTWKRVRITTTLPAEEAIYKLDLDVVARCPRCQVPNVDPNTAEKHQKEPWDEMMKFRRVDQGSVAKWKPCFGMLCIPKNEGKIEVGAMLEVLETTSNHSFNTRKFEDL